MDTSGLVSMRYSLLVIMTIWVASTDARFRLREALGSALEEDIGAALWEGVDDLVMDSVWVSPEHAPQLNFTYSVSDFTTPVPEVSSSVADNYSLPDEDVSLESAIVNLSFQEEIADMDRQINAFIDKVVDNSTEWTFVSLITLMPLRCSAVNKVVQLFDEAMAKVNPESSVTSVAQRLGSTPCSGNGICPCTENGLRRKYTTRVMELRSRSRSPSLVYPETSDFPYHVDIQPVALER